MTFIFLAKVVPFVSLFASGVWAQFDMAQCKTGYEWACAESGCSDMGQRDNRNYLGQDPCIICSILNVSCRGLGVYNYPPLNDSSQYYPLPSKNRSGDTTYNCNTVMYNLYGVHLVSGGQIDPWETWMAACESIYTAQCLSTVPQGTAVPRWAFFDVASSVDQIYDEATMINIGRDPEETPPLITIVLPSSTLLTPGDTSFAPSGTKNSIGRPGSRSDSSNNTNGGTDVRAIFGGVFGSIVPLTILAVVAFIYMRHCRLQ